MMPDWQIRRSLFNHDWLKNKFINRLGAFIERLESSVFNPVRIAGFLEIDLPEWEENRYEAQSILDSFEEEMSPRDLLNLTPLSRCSHETKQWVGELIHALWLTRSCKPMKLRVQESKEALLKAHNDYKTLAEELKHLKNIEDDATLNELSSLVPQFLRFKGSCEQLSEKLSALPREIWVV